MLLREGVCKLLIVLNENKSKHLMMNEMFMNGMNDEKHAPDGGCYWGLGMTVHTEPVANT